MNGRECVCLHFFVIDNYLYIVDCKMSDDDDDKLRHFHRIYLSTCR